MITAPCAAPGRQGPTTAALLRRGRISLSIAFFPAPARGQEKGNIRANFCDGDAIRRGAVEQRCDDPR